MPEWHLSRLTTDRVGLAVFRDTSLGAAALVLHRPLARPFTSVLPAFPFRTACWNLKLKRRIRWASSASAFSEARERREPSCAAGLNPGGRVLHPRSRPPIRKGTGLFRQSFVRRSGGFVAVVREQGQKSRRPDAVKIGQDRVAGALSVQPRSRVWGSLLRSLHTPAARASAGSLL